MWGSVRGTMPPSHCKNAALGRGFSEGVCCSMAGYLCAFANDITGPVVAPCLGAGFGRVIVRGAI